MSRRDGVAAAHKCGAAYGHSVVFIVVVCRKPLPQRQKPRVPPPRRIYSRHKSRGACDTMGDWTKLSKVARWQNWISSFPWIAPGWRAWKRNPRKGRDQILQRSVAEPQSRSPKGQNHTISKSGYGHLATMGRQARSEMHQCLFSLSQT